MLHEIKKDYLLSEDAISVSITTTAPPTPDSWYFACLSADLKPGKMKSIILAGKEVLIYRSEDGQALASDPFCPHLGIRFMAGGTVVGSDLKCPSHEFTFGKSGECTGVPCGGKIPPGAKLKMHHVRDINGLILIWYSATESAPWFDVEELDFAGYSDPIVQILQIKSHPQDIFENGFDLLHFSTVHKNRFDSVESDGFEFFEDKNISTMTLRKKNFSSLPFSKPTQTVTKSVTTTFGLGYSVIEATPSEKVETKEKVGYSSVIFILNRPTHEGCVEVAVIGRIKLIPSDEVPKFVRNYVLPIMQKKAAVYAFSDAMAALEEDIPLWQGRQYMQRPALCEMDGPIGKYRRWGKRFYARNDDQG